MHLGRFRQVRSVVERKPGEVAKFSQREDPPEAQPSAGFIQRLGQTMWQRLLPGVIGLGLGLSSCAVFGPVAGASFGVHHGPNARSVSHTAPAVASSSSRANPAIELSISRGWVTPEEVLSRSEGLLPPSQEVWRQPQKVPVELSVHEVRALLEAGNDNLTPAGKAAVQSLLPRLAAEGADTIRELNLRSSLGSAQQQALGGELLRAGTVILHGLRGPWSIEAFKLAKAFFTLASRLGYHPTQAERIQLQGEILAVPAAMAIAPAEIRRDRDFSLEFIGKNGASLSLLEPELSAQRPFLLAALASNPQVFSQLSAAEQHDPVLLRAALKSRLLAEVQGHGASAVVHPEALSRYFELDAQGALKRSPEIIRAVVAADKLWLLRAFDEQAILQVPEAQKAALDYWQPLDRLGIEFPERFDKPQQGDAKGIEVLREVELNRLRWEKGLDDPRPLAVVIYPKLDEVGAFTGNHLAKLMDVQERQKGYNVLYYEASTDQEVIELLLKATRDGKRPASLLVLGGHGWRNQINYSTPDEGLDMVLGRIFEEQRQLGTEDTSQLEAADLGNLVIGDVVLDSCSTGEKGLGILSWLFGLSKGEGLTSENIAELLSRIFIHARTWAPSQPTSSASYVVDQDQHFTGIDSAVPISTYGPVAPPAP